MAADVEDLVEHAVSRMGLSPEVEEQLRKIHAELAVDYRERFIEMAQAIQRQASAIERIQRTLEILIDRLGPAMRAGGDLPTAFRIAGPDDETDVARAVVVADPIAVGYTLSQADLAAALRLHQPDVSVLVRAFGLTEDPDCAVQVRYGGRGRNIFNYHPRAIDKLRELIVNPPPGLKRAAEKARERALAQLEGRRRG